MKRYQKLRGTFMTNTKPQINQLLNKNTFNDFEDAEKSHFHLVTILKRMNDEEKSGGF